MKEGKKRFDLLTSEYRTMYINDEWWGWHALINDWKDNIWILKHLTRWYKGDVDEIIKNLK